MLGLEVLDMVLSSPTVERCSGCRNSEPAGCRRESPSLHALGQSASRDRAWGSVSAGTWPRSRSVAMAALAPWALVGPLPHRLGRVRSPASSPGSWGARLIGGFLDSC